GGWIILIQTRWHEDDLAGSILPEDWSGGARMVACRDRLDWDVLCVAACAHPDDDPPGRKPGEYLWPPWFDRARRAQFERVPRTWSALYQQKPAPETGIVFEAAWLRTYDRMPPRENLRVYGASDYAVSEGRGDYTVHVVVGLDPSGRMYVLDLWRRQASSDVWVEAFCDLGRRGEALRGAGGRCVRRWGARGSGSWWGAGSRSRGRKRAARSAPASGRSSSGGCASARPSYGAASFRRAATRPCARSRSSAAWGSRGFICRPRPPGRRRCAPSCCVFRTGATTIRSMRSASSAS